MPIQVKNASKQVVDVATVTDVYGTTADAAAESDTANVGLLALFKRLLVQFTALLGRLPAALTNAGNLKVSLQEQAGTLTIAGNVNAAVTGTVTVSNPGLTNAELRAAAVPVSAAALPLPTGAATEATLATASTAIAATNTALGTPGSTPPALPGGATGVTGWLRYLASLLPNSVGRQALAASLSVAPALGLASTVTVNITRPSDIITYAGMDAIGHLTTNAGSAVLEFQNFGPANAEMSVSSVKLRIDSTALISGEAGYRVYLFSAAPPSNLADNAAFTFPAGDQSAYLDYIDLGVPVDHGNTLECGQHNLNRSIKLGPTGSLFVYLVTLSVYAPASGRSFALTISGEVRG